MITYAECSTTWRGFADRMDQRMPRFNHTALLAFPIDEETP